MDGSILPASRPVVCADDSSFLEGRGCYTTARVAQGRIRWEDRHVARLLGGVRALRLGALDAETIRRAFHELAEAALPSGEGCVRLQVSRTEAGQTHLVGTVRALGDDRPEWSAIVAGRVHEGVSRPASLKVTSRLTMALANDDARAAGVDEAILLDGAGMLVEGTRSNLFVAGSEGALWTPPVAAGVVVGIARAVVLERLRQIEEREVSKCELLDAPELIAVNALRGARPITRLDGEPVGDGRPGPWSRRLAEALASD